MKPPAKTKRPDTRTLKDATPHQRVERLIYGAKALEQESEYRLAHRINHAVQLALKAKYEGRKLQVFQPPPLESEAAIFKDTMVACFDLILNCARKRNGAGLRDLADCIETVADMKPMTDQNLCRYLMQHLAIDQFTGEQLFCGTRETFYAALKDQWRKLGRNQQRLEKLRGQFKRFEGELGLKFVRKFPLRRDRDS
ncbi:MAG: hypothetical protein EBS05_15985 [Proteobacteria bacterium]|nr:hypothetical protein [Pseudomonadota bacterium]